MTWVIETVGPRRDNEIMNRSDFIQLSVNENPAGPSPHVLLELKKSLGTLNRYPDSHGRELKRRLSRKFQLEENQIFLGNGSNEIIELLIRRFCNSRSAILTSDCAFIAYRICAHNNFVRCVESPMNAERGVDLKALEVDLKKDSSIKMVFLANPNNPTGSFLSKQELKLFLNQVAALENRSVLVVLDCAYFEYLENESEEDPAELLLDFPNLIILRTFSKIYGMAGLRVGYGLANEQIWEQVEKLRLPFNVNSLAQKAARMALEDSKYIQAANRANFQALRFWREQLQSLELKVLPTAANFLCVDFSSVKRGADEIVRECFKQGVKFQSLANYQMNSFVRISTGTREENEMGALILKQVFSTF